MIAGVLLPQVAVPSDLDTRSGEAIEEIVVTGSHLDLPERNMPAPVVVIRADEIAAGGANTVAEAVRHLSYNSGIPNDAALGHSAIAGTAFVNLRGIGAQNTLVLVNGKRVSPYGAAQVNGQTIVDINALPVGAIDRIEILKDGASAVYGSDAVAGVVNIIMKQHQEGLSVGAGYLSTSRHDQDEQSLDATWGAKTGATAIFAMASFLKRDRLRSADRNFLADGDLRNVGGFNSRSNFSSPVTAFRLAIGEVHAEPTCPIDEDDPAVFLEPFPRPNPVLKSFCKYNIQLYTDAVPASERTAVGANIEQTLSRRTSLAAELFASRNRTHVWLPPDPTDRTASGTGFPEVAAEHPFNPFGERLGIMYRVVDTGPRTRRATSEAGRASAGLHHEGDRWDVELSVQAALSNAAMIDFNVIDAAAFQEALLGRGGSQGAAFYNPFGLGVQNPDDVVGAVTVRSTSRVDSFRETSGDVSANRTLWRLEGGSARLAFGGQQREQKGYQVADEFQHDGVALGLDLLPPYSARRRIRAAYAELSLPFTEAMIAQLALRHEQYSDFGNSTNPKLAVLWRGTSWIALRASWGTSFRAPSLGELYRPRRETLSFERDVARCSITGAPLDCSRFPYRTISGGNPGLRPEEGRSAYLGLSIAHPARESLSLDLGVWQLDQQHRTVEPGAAFILEHFGLDPDFVLRSEPVPTDPPGVPGRIVQINSFVFNLESLRTRGVDVDARWRPGSSATGLELRLGASYLDSYRVDLNSARAQRSELAGGAELFPLPRIRANATARWDTLHGGWFAAAHYTGPYRSPLNLVIGGEESNVPYRIDDHLTLDLQYSHAIGPDGGTLLRAGCRNCFDVDPPPYNYTTTGEYLHDPRGAIVYLRLVWRLH